MKRRACKTGLWLGSGVLVVLLARSIAYAVSPAPAARVLEGRAGGPSLPVVTLVALALGASLAIAICALAAMGVNERARLESRRLATPAPSLGAGRMVLSALLLSATTSIAGGLFEAFLHWRAGLGWHGLHCLTGPVHHNLIPIATALSFIAAALIASGGQVAAWMRRTYAALGAPALRIAVAALVLPTLRLDTPRNSLQVGTSSARAPPAVS
ncbi:MAG: hypothetical protein QOG93_993 [Gaiellaceae bacterium]|jgi:hypothetical protein|nr:hypothetical protein [Gaiellaceae bacterium]